MGVLHMKVKLVVSLLVSFGISSTLFAGQELKVNLGASMYLEDSFKEVGGNLDIDSAPVLSLLYQHPISEVIAWGGELRYSFPTKMSSTRSSLTETNSTSAEISSTAFFANLLATKKLTGFYPYVGVGIGASHNLLSNIKAQSISASDGNQIAATSTGSITSFAYQFFGGFDFDITERLFVGLSLKYADFGPFKSGKETIVTGKDAKGDPVNDTFSSPYKSSKTLKAMEFSLGLGWMI
jgi:opacity protein-like surface antigen